MNITTEQIIDLAIQKTAAYCGRNIQPNIRDGMIQQIISEIQMQDTIETEISDTHKEWSLDRKPQENISIRFDKNTDDNINEG